METKPSLVIARKVFLEYFGVNKFPKHKVILNSFEIVQMIATGIERALAEKPSTSEEQLATPAVVFSEAEVCDCRPDQFCRECYRSKGVMITIGHPKQT